MTLIEALLALQDPRSAARRDAAEAVLRWCESDGRKILLGRYGQDMRHSEMPDHAIDQVLTKAASQSPASRFRGVSQGEAAAWCTTVLLHSAADWWRRHGQDFRARKHAKAQDDGAGPPAAEARGDVSEREEFELNDLLATIERTIRILDLAGHLSHVERSSIACAVEHKLRMADVEQQIDRWGFSGKFASEPRTGESRKRARDRVYQYRKRGMEGLAQLLAVAVRNSTLDAESAAAIAALFGLPWPPPPVVDTSKRRLRVVRS